MSNNSGFERYTDRHILSIPPIILIYIGATLTLLTVLYLFIPEFSYFIHEIYRTIRGVELICSIEKGVYNTTGIGLDWFYPCLTKDAKTIRFLDLLKETLIANIFLMPVIIGACLWMMKALKKEHPASLFQKPLSLEQVENLMQGDYPHIKYFRRLELVQDDIKSGKIPSGLSVKDWILKHRVIEDYRETKSDDFDISLNREKIYHLFEAQLGQKKIDFFQKVMPCIKAYQDLASNPKSAAREQKKAHFASLVQALDEDTKLEIFLIAFAAPRVYCLNETLTKADEERALKDHDTLAKEFWNHFINAEDESGRRWYQKPLNGLEIAFDYWLKYCNNPEVESCFKAHGYVSTVIMALYKKAKVAPADVGWIRAYNRRVWYIIQNTGRPTHFIENAGAACHYSAEKANNGELLDPEFLNAFSALRWKCSSIVFTETEIKKSMQ